MESLPWIISSSLIVIGLGCGLLFFLFHLMKRQINAEVGKSQEQFLQLAKSQFELEQQKASGEFEKGKQALDTDIRQLKEQLDKYERLVRDFEKDRQQKYGNLEAELKNATLTTQNLQESTNKLNNILGNVKLRGQWGERAADDIIRYAGLIEGVNYKKQSKLSSSSTKPDFTFILPDQHIINMDVKFPLDNYLHMANAKEKETKEKYQKDFERNVKDRIKEIQGRDYINPAENTLDFVLLFIPNEQVFGYIQDLMPTLMDDSLKQRVVLCSPFTLYAMLCVIRQAYEHFRFEKDIKNIITLIEGFTSTYKLFKDRFEEIGSRIEKLDNIYNDVKSKSFKNLDSKINKIDQYKKGKGLEADSDKRPALEVASEVIDEDAIV